MNYSLVSSFALILVISSIHGINLKRLDQKIDAYQKKDSWAYKTIKEDLKSWNTMTLDPEVLISQIDLIEREKEYVYVIEFSGNKYASYTSKQSTRSKKNRFKVLFESLEALSKYKKIPDCLFLLSLSDTVFEDLPVLTFAKSKHAKSIRIPDFEALQGYKKLKNQVVQKSKNSFWKSKKDLVFWRGSSTGGTFNRLNYQDYPRSKAVIYSLSNPEILDARFTSFVQIDPECERYLINQGMQGDSVSIEDSVDYKFLLDVDGNSCTYSRMFWILLSNSILFKLESPNVQWYYSLLENRKNFVSIKSDLSNLQSEFAYYLKHPEEAEKIAESATQLTLEELDQESCLAYLYCVISEISKLQKKYYKN